MYLCILIFWIGKLIVAQLCDAARRHGLVEEQAALMNALREYVSEAAGTICFCFVLILNEIVFLKNK